MQPRCWLFLVQGQWHKTTEGTIVVSGSLNVWKYNYERPNNENTNTSINLSPSIGYFLTDGLEVGIAPGYGFGRSTSENDSLTQTSKDYSIRIGPYIKKYIPITEKLHFTAAGNFGIAFSRAKNEASGEESFKDGPKSFSYHIGAAPGLTYFATEKLGFSLSLGGVHLTRTHYRSKRLLDSTNKSTTTSFDATISPSSSYIGISYFINR